MTTLKPHWTSTISARVEWLKRNRHLWEHIDWSNLHWADYRRERLELVTHLKAAGLYSLWTNACDINVIGLIKRVKQTEA